jgi:hypothetical protein
MSSGRALAGGSLQVPRKRPKKRRARGRADEGVGANAAIDVDRQSFLGKLVGDAQALSAQYPRYGYRALPLLGRDRKRRAGRTRCGPTTSCSILAPTASSPKWEFHHQI